MQGQQRPSSHGSFTGRTPLIRPRQLTRCRGLKGHRDNGPLIEPTNTAGLQIRGKDLLPSTETSICTGVVVIFTVPQLRFAVFSAVLRHANAHSASSCTLCRFDDGQNIFAAFSSFIWWNFFSHDRELQSQTDAEYFLKNLREVKPDGLLQQQGI